jgi:hypothetical protein
MRIILTALLLVVVGCSSGSKPKPPELGVVKGHDVLGLAKQCETIKQSPPVDGIGVLMKTFGNPMPCVEELIKAWPQLRFVRVHCANGPCARNRRCEPGEPSPTDINNIRQCAKTVQNYVNVFGKQTIFALSPVLEHDIRDANTVKALFDAAKAECPGCMLIQNPESGAVIDGYPLEAHGNREGWLRSPDGISYFDTDSGKWCDKAQVCLSWVHEDNGNKSGVKNFVAPSQRRCFNDQELMLQRTLMLTSTDDNKPFPAGCRIKRELQGRELWKTNSESYCPKQDNRENKYVFISRWTEKILPLVDSSGREVGRISYYGTYDGYGERGWHRHYIGHWGGSGETPAQMYTKVGGESLFIKRGDECIRVNSIRRKGFFR